MSNMSVAPNSSVVVILQVGKLRLRDRSDLPKVPPLELGLKLNSVT